MLIDEQFNFGKYKGLTLKEVYQGTNQINKELLKGYISEKLSTVDPDIVDDAFLIEIMHFEVSDTLLRVTPIMDDFKGDWSKTLGRLLKNGSVFMDKLIGHTNLDEYNIQKYSAGKGKPEITGGNPEYIEWCIKNVDYFNLAPETLGELQSLDVYRFVGINITFKIDDIYEYKPNISIMKYQFADDIIEKNGDKFEAANPITDYSGDYIYDNDYERSTYEKYGGSYAQDVEGWSDQDIDDAFGGEPDAYWNID